MKRTSLIFTCAPLAALLLACGSSKPEAQAPAATPVATEPAAPDPAAATEARVREILAMPHRTDAERHRDQYRHPAETLAFFGVAGDQTIVELSPGAGWYTNILGPLTAPDGRLISAGADPATAKAGYQRDNAIKLRDQIAAHKDLFATTEMTVMSFAGDTPRLELGHDGSADAVLTFRNVHNWAKAEKLDAVLAAAFKALKPGGILGIEDHRAGDKQTLAQAMEAGYLPEAWVIERVQAAGFTFVAKSEINANPKDTKDHPNGVWSLPPTVEGGDKDKDKFLAIGESDRMTLKFQKPAK